MHIECMGVCTYVLRAGSVSLQRLCLSLLTVLLIVIYFFSPVSPPEERMEGDNQSSESQAAAFFSSRYMWCSPFPLMHIQAVTHMMYRLNPVVDAVSLVVVFRILLPHDTRNNEKNIRSYMSGRRNLSCRRLLTTHAAATTWLIWAYFHSILIFFNDSLSLL